MSEALKEAGRFELVHFRIFSYDHSKQFELKDIIHSFEIHESMKRGSIRGFAKMYDSVGLLQDFPLRGEEFIEIKYKDFYENELTEKMFLYAISDVKQPVPSNPSRWEYTIHFVSRPKIYQEKELIRRTYSGAAGARMVGNFVHEFVKDVYEEFLGPGIDGLFRNSPFALNAPKNIHIQNTDGKHKYVIPNYTPEQTMQFFARHAYSADPRLAFSQTFRFFENRHDYVFGTNEYCQQVPYNFNNMPAEQFTFKQNFQPEQTPEGQQRLQTSILDIDYGEAVNTIQDINSGGYFRRTFEVDINYNIIDITQYSYVNNFNSNNPRQRLYHTPQFVQERVERPRDRWVIRDYNTEGTNSGPEVRSNTFYPEIYNRKPTHFYHTDKNRVNITVYGNNRIVAGSTINIKLLKHTSEDQDILDAERSGAYLVESIENVFFENSYVQKLTVTRNGVGI